MQFYIIFYITTAIIILFLILCSVKPVGLWKQSISIFLQDVLSVFFLFADILYIL
jgi:hypothetical protein